MTSSTLPNRLRSNSQLPVEKAKASTLAAFGVRSAILASAILFSLAGCQKQDAATNPTGVAAADAESPDVVHLTAVTAGPEAAESEPPCTEPKTPAEATKVDGASSSAPPNSSTHKQAQVIKPMHQRRSVTLMNYCLDGEGNLWMSVSTAQRRVRLEEETPENFVQVYDPQGNLKAEYAIPMAASAVNFAPDGTFVISGEGKVARLSAKGELLKVVDTPNIGDMATFRKRVAKQAEEQREQSRESFAQHLEAIDQQIKTIEENEPDETKRTPKQVAMLRSLKMQRKQFDTIVNRDVSEIDVDNLVRYKLSAPGIAATEKDVFIALSGDRGYEIWRTNYDFEDATIVARNLSGCCGNMDIQAQGEGFVASVNGEFKVVSFNRDGKRGLSFGNRSRSGVDGFGSCCNPMNSRQLAGGDYIVAESSIGNIKRYSVDGKFAYTVGKARISGGCKHCSLGYDPKLDRYYMMNEDHNHVCVLLPLSEAPALTEEERQAKEAKEGLGKKLVGDWSESKVSPPEPQKNPLGGILSLFQSQPQAQSTNVQMTVQADGGIKSNSGAFANFAGSQMTWEPVKQSGKTLTLGIYLDGVEIEVVDFEFVDDDHFQVSRDGRKSYFFGTCDTLVRQSANSTRAASATAN